MMEYYAGLDVSLRSCAVCIVDTKGTVVFERELACEVSDISNCLREFANPIERIGFEAGTMSQHLFFGLQAEGFDVVCMEARQVNAALSAMRNKTGQERRARDRADFAHGMVQPGSYEEPRSAWPKALLSSRKALLNKTIDLANEVRGLLKIFGLRLPKTVSHGSFDDIVRPMIQMDEVLIHVLIPLLDARVALYQHYLELDRRVKRAASHDEVCMRLMTVPGVGPIAALTFKAAVDDPLRFKSSRTVAAHLVSRRDDTNPARATILAEYHERATAMCDQHSIPPQTPC